MNKAIIVAVTSLILVRCGWFLANKAVSNRKIRIGVYALFFCITLACAITVRNIQADFPDAKLMAAILKFCASAPSLLLALRGFLMEKNRFDLRIVIALALCLMADVIINFSLVAGGSVFAIAHMIFTITFIIENKPDRKQKLAWLILTLVIAVILVLIYSHINNIPMYLFALAYLSIMISTVVFSVKLNKLIFVSAIIFALSDCFLIFNMTVKPTVLMKLAALLIYYISLHLYGIAVWEISYPHEKI